MVLERGFSKTQLQRFHREYSIKLAGPSPDDETTKEEIRALVVIKTSPKTKARQRKIAVGNWKVSNNACSVNGSTENEPRHEKSCFRDLRPRKTQTGLLSYRD